MLLLDYYWKWKWFLVFSFKVIVESSKYKNMKNKENTFLIFLLVLQFLLKTGDGKNNYILPDEFLNYYNLFYTARTSNMG